MLLGGRLSPFATPRHASLHDSGPTCRQACSRPTLTCRSNIHSFGSSPGTGSSVCPSRNATSLSPVCRPPTSSSPSSSRPSVTASELPPPAPSPPAASPELFVGVDFGTSESGFAYRYMRPGEEAGIRFHQNWPDQPQDVAGPKTRTAILYHLDDKGRAAKADSWGWTARMRWLSLSAEERPRYAYLENFKLLLHEGERQGKGQGPLDTVCPLPPNLTPTQVAADFLTEMKRYALLDLRRQGVSVRPEAVRWCVTLPAMWTEADKRRVRDAAERTGMSTSANPSSLLLTLEPEAAVLAVAANDEREQQQEWHDGDIDEAAGSSGGRTDKPHARQSTRPAKARLSAEDVVLVLDCGGGTVDLTLARVYGTGKKTRMEEEAVGRGLLAGSRFVDAVAYSLLRTLVGEGPWDEWRKSHPDEWAQLEERWETVKRGFFLDQKKDVSLLLPQRLMEAVGTKRLKETLFVQASSSCTNTSPADPAKSGPWPCRVSLPEGRLALPAAAVEAVVFRPVVDKIIAAAKEMVEESRAAGGKPVDKLLLVGGFGASRYLQERVKQELGSGGGGAVPVAVWASARAAVQAKATRRAKPRVVEAAHPAAAVLEGAVLFGQQPGSFSARRCRLSYGFDSASLWNEQHAEHSLSHGYPKMVVRTDDGKLLANEVFLQFVKRGQLVRADEVVRKFVSPVCKSQKLVAFRLYDTKSQAGRYTCEPGMHHVATVELDLPPGWSDGLDSASTYGLQVELRFGSTELTVVAKDVHTGDAVAGNVLWDGELED